MQTQKLIRIAVYTTAVILIYLFVKILSFHSSSHDIKITDVTSHRFSHYGFVFPSTFNRSCTSRFLGLPATLAKRCSSTTNWTANATLACAHLTCQNLLYGNDRQLADIAANITMPRKMLTSEEVSNETSDCVAFRKSRGFHTVVEPEAEDFPIAYNILVHSNANQLIRLLRAIYRPNNVICIHVDNKAAPSFRSAVESILRCFDNIRLASHSEAIIWGGYSRLQADINCMKDHVKAGGQWKYLINTAALAFPLRTVEEAVKILRVYNGGNDVEGIYGSQVLRFRFENEWIERIDQQKVFKTGRLNPKPPHNIDIVRGSAYAIFSRGFVEFIIQDKRAQDLLEWSRRTWSPDEFYWATLHHTYANPDLHTPGGNPGYPSNKTFLAVYANWGDEHCHGQYVRRVCVFGVGDLPILLRRRELFANKLYEDFQPLALDCLEAWIRHKEVCPPHDDLDYYRQLPFVL